MGSRESMKIYFTPVQRKIYDSVREKTTIDVSHQEFFWRMFSAYAKEQNIDITQLKKEIAND